MGKKAKKSRKRGKSKPKPRPLSKKWEKYEVKGDTVTRKQKYCPKCGPGIFMANHKNRMQCGKCGYTEFIKQTK